MNLSQLSPWQLYREKYRNGCGSGLCELATKVCLIKKGSAIPCDVLFVAEAPGESEDALGLVLCGPAGKYFDDILAQSVPQGVTTAATNIVGCMPRENDNPKKAGQPSQEEIEGCSKRLKDFIVLCNPKLLINVGTLSRDMMDRKSSFGYKTYWRDIDRILGREIPMEWVLHPSFLLRQNLAIQTLMRRKTILTIRNSINKYVLGMKDLDE